VLQYLRNWLTDDASRRKVRAPRRSLGLLRQSQIDVLEDRRLLSVAPTADEVIAAPLSAGAQVVGRSIFYNNSRFDGYNPAITAADAAALATDKVALLPGQTAGFANYTSALAGINGIMVDIAGLTGTPTAADFLFHVGNNSAIDTWAEAPKPSAVSVQTGAGVGGSTRVTIVWPDGLIRNQWLQVDVRVTGNTGLAQPDVFYFGNSVAETGNTALNAQVNMTDQLATRANATAAGVMAAVTSRYDFNRDGLVNTTDELMTVAFASNAATALRLIAPGAGYVWSDVVARSVFYNNSAFDGNNPSANASDDGAIAPDKRALLPGQTATLANYTNYSRGLNGVMIDIAGAPQNLTAGDFEFRMGNSMTPSQWSLAPAPAIVTIRYGAGLGGSARVTLVWPDGAISKQWLQVTVKATSNTKLATPDVFYFGNAIGETGDSVINAVVNTTDYLRVGAGFTPGPVGINSVLDVNRDNAIDLTDRNLVLANQTSTLTALKLLSFEPVVTASPASAPSVSPFEPVYTNYVQAGVLARRVFYNSSKFDGNTPLATAGDSAAIATDKQALLPGQTASFANYTSYSRGLNGIMIDVANLPGPLSAGDFDFRVGNSSTTGSWSAAPVPLSISTQAGAGVNGSTRITIIWADNLIQNQWLRVTLRATAATGLAHPDVFYFGNAIGETGNSAFNARVDFNDQLLARNNATAVNNPQPLTNRFDFNRDGLVDTTEEWITMRGMGGAVPLQLIAPPLEPITAEPQRQPLELFHRGDSSYNVFFGPNLVQTTKGTVLALAEGRWGLDDFTSFAIVQRRSTDGGATWSPITTVAGVAPYSGTIVSNASAVVDQVTGEIIVVYVVNWSLVFVTSSADDGLSWSTPREITSSVKVTSQGNPNPGSYPDTPWGWYVVGPGHGIQLQHGQYAGRLLMGGDHRLSEDRSTPSWSHVIYSDDHGLTWHLGGGVDQTNPQNLYANESAVVEQSDGGVYMTIRVNNGSPYRGYSRSYDGGLTWSDMLIDQQLTTFPVQASLLRVNADTVLLAAPDSLDGTRHQMTLWLSRDNMQTWTKTKTVFYGYAGYSDMTLVGEDTILLAYNRGHATGGSAQSVGLARFTLEWLEDGEPYQFLWHFNEETPGTKANLEGTSITDYSPWDNRAQALAHSPAEAPLYVAGPNGHRALRLTPNSDAVLLTPNATYALQFAANESFTVEMSLRTTDANGVLIGGTPGLRGWTLSLDGGKPRLEVFDGAITSSVTSNLTINDGNWHRVAVVRDAATHRLRVYVDDQLAALEAVDQTIGTLLSNSDVWLGSMNDGSRQLAFDVDTLRVTRTALPTGQLMTATLAEPPLYQAPAFRPSNPTTMAGLQFWLPSYDPTRYFADLGYADPMPLAPVSGTATRSAIEASPNGYHVEVRSDMHEVLYATDNLVGPHWVHSALTAAAGEPWVVKNSNGTSPTNFDFVQNTGVFTLSTFIRFDATLGANMVLFDTAESTSSNSGFTLLVTPSGALTMLVVGAPGTIRFNQNTSTGTVSSGTWYHVAAVGTGPGNPIKFYVTAVNDNTVNTLTSTKLMTGADGNYPTDANHNLTIGSLTNSGNGSFNGRMVDQAVFNRALSAAEIQQLFDYTVHR